MEQLLCKNLSFTYPSAKNKALDGISFSAERGEFIILCGKSGCGKTTLLRHIKSELAPFGEKSGEIFLGGKALSDLDEREKVSRIAYVMQDPQAQTVADTVRRELAFMPENLGISPTEMSMRISEAVSYFGLENIYGKKTSEISGGQKQLTALAAVTLCDPEILLLDEPLSQLDPVSADSFISAVVRLNRENGVTVIMSAHGTREALPYADRIILMDKGKIAADRTADKLFFLPGEAKKFDETLTPSMRIFSALGADRFPVTAGECASLLSELVGTPTYDTVSRSAADFSETAIKIRGLTYSYGKNLPPVLRGADANIPKGCIYAISGGNGSGKSTLLKLIAGMLKTQSGKIGIGKNIRVGYMPQNILPLFTKETVALELGGNAELARLCCLEDLSWRNPFDLSGGERQRLALALTLENDPDIILLDEPTKGTDHEFGLKLADILRSLKAKGKTVVLVSHDTEFCARCADRCAMLFDGRLCGEADAADFFCNNTFYTTDANRISRHIFKNCVTEEDVISLCLKNAESCRS